MTPPVWRKSSRSTQGTSGQCVELTRFDGAVCIRDSKNPAQGQLSVSPAGFSTLVYQIKSNNLDL